MACSAVASPDCSASMALVTISRSTSESGSGNGGDGIGPAGPVMADTVSARKALTRGPVCAGTLGLEEHPAGVEAEPGHGNADLVLPRDRVRVGAVEGLAQEELARQEQAAAEPVGFLLLLGVAGEEGVAADLLDLADVVAEQDVGDLV